jgi:predicted GNAT family N-acyltransferase
MRIEFVNYLSEQYYEILKLRREVLRKPLGLDYNDSQLLEEKDNLFLAYYLDDKIIGCLLLRPLSQNELKVRQVAVDFNIQGKGIGLALMKFVENYAKENGFSKISLHARETAMNFYLKLNYQVLGNKFYEINLAHYKMFKQIY